MGATAGESVAAMFVNSDEKLLTSRSLLMAGLNGASVRLLDTSCQSIPCENGADVNTISCETRSVECEHGKQNEREMKISSPAPKKTTYSIVNKLE